MATSGDDKERRKKIRLYFRRIVRTVILNRSWLVDTGDQKLTLNVKRNVALFVRQVRKIGVLTLAEKTLIRTPPALRTVAERKKLVHLLSNLPCFSTLPPKVRARLVPVISFLVLGPDRLIMREGDPPHFLYFVLSGDLAITKKVYDPVKKEYIEKRAVVVGAGDWVGDTGMIEKSKRQISCTTLTDSELLVVYSDDFDRILRPVMERQWFDKMRAMKSLGYFDLFDEKQIKNGCRMGFLRQYEPLENIYYEDKGPLTFVHFVVSGECMILQCLRMKVTTKIGKKKKYELVPIKGRAGDLFNELTNADLRRLAAAQGRSQFKKQHNFLFDDISQSDDDPKSTMSKSFGIHKMNTKGIQAACAARKAQELSYQMPRVRSQSALMSSRSSFKMSNMHADKDNDDDFVDLYEGGGGGASEGDENSTSFKDIESDSSRYSDALYTKIVSHKYELKSKVRESVEAQPEAETEQSEEELSVEELEHEEDDYLTDRESQVLSPNTKIENHFIDVGSLTVGGIFGLGETLEHRVIMARTTVQCFLIPRFWLFEKNNNPAGIWDRRRFYLDFNIPTRDQLFQNFLTTRKWQKFKHDLIQANVAESLKYNPTKVEDIPIICRIVEATDD